MHVNDLIKMWFTSYFHHIKKFLKHVKKAETYLWSEKDSPGSASSIPVEANITVVSRSAIIPLITLDAFMHAWVPDAPVWRADITQDT